MATPETWCHSAHEVGKSFTAALTGLWWFLTRPAKVLITSSSEDQIRGAIWGEIDRLLRTATLDGHPCDFGGLIRTDLELRHADEKDKPIATYSLRCKVTNKIESAQGRHEPKLDDGGGTVLIIVEEGSSLEETLYDSFSSQAHSLLVIGNPMRTEGIFYRKCTSGDQRHPDGSGRLFSRVIHVSGEHSPNVRVPLLWTSQGNKGSPPCPVAFRGGKLSFPVPGDKPIDWKIPGILSYDTYLEHLCNWTADKVRTRLHGLFPDEAGQKLFPPEWLDIARALGRKLAAYNSQPGRERGRLRTGRPFALGIDVSQGGGDLTVWCVLGRWGVPYVRNDETGRWEWAIYAKATPDTTEIAGTALRLMKRFGIAAESVALDAGGGGKQIADMLRDKGYDVSDVDFGSAADDPSEYRNRRCQLYGELRKALDPGAEGGEGKRRGMARMLLETDPAEWHGKKLRCLALPPDDADLRQDLAVLPLLNDGEGRLRLPPKDKARKTSGRTEQCVREMLGGRSPDRGDALALAYWAWESGREFRKASVVGDDAPLVW